MKHAPKNVAVFYICGLGDAICTLPGLFALKRSFPLARITVIINEKLVYNFFNLLDHKFSLIDFSPWAKASPRKIAII